MDNKVYNQFNNPVSEGQVFTEKTKTQQHFKEQCDINKIMTKFKRTGLLPQVQRIPLYGDFSGVESYQEAVNKIKKVEEVFGTLPAAVRDRFKNDPSELIDFVQNEANRAEAIELGLIEAPAQKTENETKS